MSVAVIDFIGNPIVVDTCVFNPNSISSNLGDVVDSGEYRWYDDDKWKSFVKKYHLNPSERISSKWYEMYLTLCSEGLL